MGNRFGGFGGGGANMQAMMRQAQKMQQDALRAKEELDKTEFVGTSGGGMVEVTINGAYEMLSVIINPEAVDPDDTEMFEDLIVAAYSDAKAKADAEKSSKLGMLGGMI